MAAIMTATFLFIKDEDDNLAAIGGMPSADYALAWASRHKISAVGWNVLGTAYSMSERGALEELRKLRTEKRRTPQV